MRRGTPRRRALLEESAAWFQNRGSPDPTTILHLAAVVHAQGDVAGAAALLHEALVLQQQQANKHPIAESLEFAAELAVGQGQAGRAARLLGAAAALRESIGAPLPPGLRAGYDRAMNAARAQLEDATFILAMVKGREITVEQAIAEALSKDD